MTTPDWLQWAQRLQAIAQTGLHYNPPAFDGERYQQVMAIAAEMLAAGGAGSIDTLRAWFDQETGHATPKVDVRGVVFKGDRVLMVQERLDAGRWTLPGGWADIGEPASKAVEREIWEESGYQARATKLLAVYDRNLHDHPPYRFHAYKLFFRCELVNDDRREDAHNLETDGVDFFAPHALPELSTGRVTAAQIARFFEHAAHPDWPTDFD